ncbi:MAG TPA: serine hydrolase domain-containing protein [Nocardioides sp.]|uniref:serine hydrolase domain-containing protein n=1 Tax=Nocardioides sp. TaxID=35761 RepID=UPI002D810D16|nr:serine hydrolase domain-containing protein [Nocardioides sp.]HET6651911.1 serine hydrolase domain-containing protein [Nocardioides sp.]
MARAGLLVAAVLLSTAALAACDADEPAPAPEPEPSAIQRSVAQRADSVEEIVAADIDAGVAPGAVVVLADDSGERTVVRGVADSERRTPLRPNHSFKTAALTVPIVAATVMQMEQDGLLRRDQTVAELSPGLLAAGDRITVEELLEHASGLTEGGPASDDDAFVREIADEPLDRQPGERFEYRNEDYAVLGLVVEAVEGQPLSAVLDRRVFEPLRMRTARLAPEQPAPPGLAHGYDDGQDVTDEDLSWVGGAGAVTAGAEDMSAFLRGLFEGALVPSAAVQQMTEMRDLSFSGWSGYGLGVARVHTDCGVAYGHSGGVPGYASEAWYDLETGRSVVIMLNSVGGAVSGTVDAILQAALCD